jgi:peptidoglycan/xylan/chitin deacetylase (PgdA/CDA1 family)
MIKHRNEVKKLASIRNFELGNHSYSHPHCTCISDDSVRQELERTEFLLKSLSGTSSKLFRPPYAETNRRIECIAQKIGLTTVMYDLASGDPDSTISRARLVQYVAACARNGSILVMHVNGRGWHTAEALPEIIHILRSRGFTFVKVSELLSRAIGAGTFCSDRKNP